MDIDINMSIYLDMSISIFKYIYAAISIYIYLENRVYGKQQLLFIRSK